MTTFVEFLAALPALKLDRLYDSPWTCQAVLRWVGRGGRTEESLLGACPWACQAVPKWAVEGGRTRKKPLLVGTWHLRPVRDLDLPRHSHLRTSSGGWVLLWS